MDKTRKEKKIEKFSLTLIRYFQWKLQQQKKITSQTSLILCKVNIIHEYLLFLIASVDSSAIYSIISTTMLITQYSLPLKNTTNWL